AAICSYAIGYRFYSKWIAARVLALNERRATPCEVHDDGKDFCKTNKWIVFGHHFAAISGPGPLVGPVLAAQFGYLPGMLWIFIGGYLRVWRIGKVMEASVIGVVCLLFAVWGGKLVHESAALSRVFGMRDISLAWSIIIYGFAASVLPVWLLLAPRDYLSTFMKLGTISLLAIGIFVIRPNLQMPAFTRFIDGSGPVFAGNIFPFCFITIACGVVSGFHALF